MADTIRLCMYVRTGRPLSRSVLYISIPGGEFVNIAMSILGQRYAFDDVSQWSIVYRPTEYYFVQATVCMYIYTGIMRHII